MHDIETAETVEEIWPSYEALLKTIGVAYFGLISVTGGPLERGQFEHTPLHSNVPPALAKRIQDAGRAANYPLIRMIGRSAEPLRIPATNARDRRRARVPILNFIRKLLGPGDGLVVPVHRHGTVLGYGFLLAHPDLLDSANCAMLHLGTNAAVQRSCDLIHTQLPRDLPLTSQELACLRAAARGLSNKEVGSALAISVRTVRFHLDNVRRKLAVATRSLAIKKARLTGLVSERLHG